MPIEFTQCPSPENTGSSDNSLFRLTMAYDGSGRRISKTVMHKVAGAADWDTTQVTHYTGIGTEIRENPVNNETKVVVNMPHGLGRYKVADASQPADDNASRTFEWYLKNHLGSTMLVYGTVSSTDPNTADIGETKAAYDYRTFGEMVTLSQPSDKVTENFTGKERDDETELNYFGARYLDPMLGIWTSVDPARQFVSPYLYAGNGYNPVNGVDADGNIVIAATKQDQKIYAQFTKNLNAEQAQRLSAVERDKNFVLKFHAVDGLIPIPSEYAPNKVVAVSKGYVDATTYADQNFAAAIVCYTCEDAQGTFAHELAGHGKQILDFLNGGGITGARTLKEAAPWIEKK